MIKNCKYNKKDFDVCICFYCTDKTCEMAKCTKCKNEEKPFEKPCCSCSGFIEPLKDLNKFNSLYNELVEISNEILSYYDIDKVKPDSVYIWTKGEDGDNVFDITEDELMFYDKSHIIIEEAKPIIQKIQLKLKEISQL